MCQCLEGLDVASGEPMDEEDYSDGDKDSASKELLHSISVLKKVVEKFGMPHWQQIQE